MIYLHLRPRLTKPKEALPVTTPSARPSIRRPHIRVGTRGTTYLHRLDALIAKQRALRLTAAAA